MQNKFYFKLISASLFISFFTSVLYSDVLTNYRLHGIKNLEKELDYDLTQEKYWANSIKNLDTTFGYLESYTNILECDKSLASLVSYTKEANNSFSFMQRYDAFTGKIAGDKIKEGDLKTPIGIYTITRKLKKVDSFYGPMAFVTSYPNLYDRYKGKSGSGIWIHGFPIKEERNKFTKGCIAINNQNIQCLDKYINIEKTLLIIKENNKKKRVTKKQLSTILSSLYSWRYSWIYNQTEKYLQFYDASFIRFDGMELEKFSKYKRRIFNKKEKKTIIFNNINIIPYPGSDNIFKVTFFETYKSGTFSFSGNKILIIRLLNDSIKIVTEK